MTISRIATALTVAMVSLLGSTLGSASAFGSGSPFGEPAEEHIATRASLSHGEIEHVIVIFMENHSFDSTFGPASSATYLNKTLLSQGELLNNYYATSHVSLGNYIAAVSGQAPTPTTNSDCLQLSTLKSPPLLGGFMDVVPGTDAEDDNKYPGQVVGDGCVYPAPNGQAHGAQTIADQLEAAYGRADHLPGQTWRVYAEDMGDDPSRDFGVADPFGGTDCAHPTLGGIDLSNGAAANDQYATRHNPFVYFHSIIDRPTECNSRVVPLGKVTVGNNGNDVFTGHLAQDLKSDRTTPRFAFITPNLCNDGHDNTCVGVNTEGTHVGGLVGMDLWLKHWMPLILNSPAYRSGNTLVVLTFDEGGVAGASADYSVCCNEQPGPNIANSGYSPVLSAFGIQISNPAPGVYAGGGRLGAVLFNARYIVPGSVNAVGYYNHYSALRSYEDLLGLHSGGDDDQGHLGFAAAYGLLPFGDDVFNAHDQGGNH